MHVVVFTGGQAPLPNDTVFYFAHTPKIDYIIAADEGLDTLEAYRHFYGTTHNFRPDYILGDMDSLKDESLLKKYASVHTEIYNTEKDYTDTELAIQKAESLGLNRRRGDMITLIGGSGGLRTIFLEYMICFLLTAMQMSGFAAGRPFVFWMKAMGLGFHISGLTKESL